MNHSQSQNFDAMDVDQLDEVQQHHVSKLERRNINQFMLYNGKMNFYQVFSCRDVCMEMLKYLDVRDLYAVSQVSRYFGFIEHSSPLTTYFFQKYAYEFGVRNENIGQRHLITEIVDIPEYRKCLCSNDLYEIHP